MEDRWLAAFVAAGVVRPEMADTVEQAIPSILDGVRRLAFFMRAITAEAERVLALPEVQDRVQRAAEVLMDAKQRFYAFESPGYIPYFQDMNDGPFWARARAGLVWYRARCIHRAHAEERELRMALHALARRRRWHPSLVRHAEILSTYRDDPTLAGAFRDAQCPELAPRFEHLLRDARNGNPSSGAELIAITHKIASVVPSPRGRPLAFETALHQALLLTSGDAGGRQGYTYGLVPEGQDGEDAPSDFVDAATAATRIELARPWFNPTAARQARRCHVNGFYSSRALERRGLWRANSMR